MANAERHKKLHWQAVVWGTVICLAGSARCPASEAPAGLLACRNISDAAARLACFDREAAALAPAPTANATASPAAPPVSSAPAPAARPDATAAPAAAAPARAAPVLDPQQQFGLPERAVVAKEVAAGTRAADATKIEAHLSAVASRADRHTVFTLDNGQIWQDLLLEGGLLAKPGDEVTISRGLLGSYWLQLKSGRGCKVTRLR
jgi:hypothetical protein